MARESLGTIAPPLFANVQRSPRLDLAGRTLEAIEDFAGFVVSLAAVPPTAPIGTRVYMGSDEREAAVDHCETPGGGTPEGGRPWE